MNGAPYYSAPHRHQKGYMARLGTLAEGAVRPELSEMADLVALAIRRGLIKRPEPEPAVELKRKPGAFADWRVTVCPDCNIRFERHRKHHIRCERCRLQPKECIRCGTVFKPADRKKVCCSAECSKALQSATFKAKYGSKQPKLTECVICHQMRPVRQAGSTIAKSCSSECAAVYRKQKNAERIAKK